MSAQPTAALDPERMRSKYGPWAVIAGASEGTGAEFARQLADTGINLVLIARRLEPLQQLATELRDRYKVETRVQSIDLSAPDAGAQIQAAASGLEVGLYVSNAGADPYGSEFLARPIEDWQKLLNLNVRTVMEAVHAFAHPMKARGRGGIVLMSSGVALGGQSYLAMYSGTKGFELNFAESLWTELRPAGVDVISVAAPLMDTPALRKTLAPKGVDPKAIGAYAPLDVVRTVLGFLPEGPTYIYPVVPTDNIEQMNAARKNRLLAVSEMSKGFFT